MSRVGGVEGPPGSKGQAAVGPWFCGFGHVWCFFVFFFYRGTAEGKAPRNVAVSLDVSACAMQESVPVGTGPGAGFRR